MAWHSTWSDSQISINSVKYLVADIFNAMQERRVLVSGTQLNLPKFGGTATSVTASDYDGIVVSNQTGNNDMKYITGQIVSMIDALAVRFFDSTDFDTIYTLEDACTQAGIMTLAEFEDTENWRLKNWWLTAKAVLGLLRYHRSPFVPPSTPVYWDFTNTASTIGYSDPALASRSESSGEFPSQTWNSIGDTTSSGAGGNTVTFYSAYGVGVEVDCQYAESPANKIWSHMGMSSCGSVAFEFDINDETSHYEDYDDDMCIKTEMVFNETNSVLVDGPSPEGEVPEIDWHVDGQDFTMESADYTASYTETVTVEKTSATISGSLTLTLDLGGVPFYPVHDDDAEWGFYGEVFGTGYACYFDFNPSYVYP